jgi:hypothetical protein
LVKYNEVKVTVVVPSPVVNFVKALASFSGATEEDIWRGELTRAIIALAEEIHSPWINSTDLVSRYRLDLCRGLESKS